VIQTVGSTSYSGSLNIVTETGATVTISGSPVSGLPVAVIGNPGFVRYTVNNLSGNIAVKSTRQVYVSYFGTIALQHMAVTTLDLIQNQKL
jgi:hypothetical protein